MKPSGNVSPYAEYSPLTLTDKMQSNEFLRRLNLSQQAISGMELHAARMLVTYQTTLFTDTMYIRPNDIVWTNMVMPTELFYAMGLIPVHTELLAGWISTLGLASRYIQISQTMGYHAGLCSYHKAVIGALEQGDIPVPTLAVFSSHICDGGVLLARYLKERFGTRVFILDVPYSELPTGRADVAEQLSSLIMFLETESGHQISRGALEEAMVLSNRARQYLVMANALRSEKVLFPGHLAIRNMFGAFFLLGSELGVQVLQAYYEQLQVKKELPHKYRILWVHFAPLFAGDIMRILEGDMGCAIAFDITGYVYWPPLSPVCPLVSLAEKTLAHFYRGMYSRRRLLMRQICREFKMDGVIIFMHRGCRAIPGSSWEWREICDEIGLPYLELYGDCIDPGGFSAAQIRLRMEAFVERLEEQHHVYGN